MIRSREALERALKGGARLIETRVHEPESRSIWFVSETGESVHGTPVRLLKSNLRCLADGLFEDQGQTYEWQEALDDAA